MKFPPKRFGDIIPAAHRFVGAKLGGIPNTNADQDIEYGRDAQTSTVQQLAKSLSRRLDLVEESA